MKTFNESDLITWSNRDKAIIGDEYYFSDTIDVLNDKIKRNDTSPLASIKNGTIWHPFINNNGIAYTCILPINKVIEKEPEKKYRACMDIKDLYELVSNSKCKLSDEECIYQLIGDGYIIHIRNKKTEKEYYSKIANIAKDEENYILITYAGYSLLDLFNTFDIEINGEWQPFGILED